MDAYWRIIRDDSVVIAYNTQRFIRQDEWTTITLFGVDTPPAGSHTYKVQWRVGSGTVIASEVFAELCCHRVQTIEVIGFEKNILPHD